MTAELLPGADLMQANRSESTVSAMGNTCIGNDGILRGHKIAKVARYRTVGYRKRTLCSIINNTIHPNLSDDPMLERDSASINS